MEKYLIRGCDLANFETLGTRRVDLLVEGAFITKVQPDIVPAGDETIIEAGGKLLLPGFADCHSHLLQTFSKGYLDDYPIVEWLIRMFKIEEVMTEEDNYYAVLLGCLEGLRFGTTNINEMCGERYLDSTLQAILDSGIRATVGMSHTDIPENDVTPLCTVEQALAQSQALYEKYHGVAGGRIRTSCAPAGMPACTKEMMQALKHFTKERGLIYHTHLAEGPVETEKIRKNFGMGEGEALYHYGLLDEGTLLAHSIWLEDDELSLIAKSGANPIYCPCTNLKISDGIPKIGKMLDLGINVCIGCDGEASSSNRDMLLEAKLGAFLQKGATLRPTVMDAGTTYKMMTQNAARALKCEDTGVVEAGKRADFILVDTASDIRLSNQNTRLSNLLFAGTGDAVDTVFVDGRLILQDKKLVHFNQSHVLQKCESLLEKLDKKILTI
ncbi:amidohydrolase family protein [Oscillospiraceae bacterium MB08-C2-2]|nr:amidohydrolase family protein [Oscillospiraceae bacterium MB08-C2-2]